MPNVVALPILPAGFVVPGGGDGGIFIGENGGGRNAPGVEGCSNAGWGGGAVAAWEDAFPEGSAAAAAAAGDAEEDAAGLAPPGTVEVNDRGLNEEDPLPGAPPGG